MADQLAGAQLVPSLGAVHWIDPEGFRRDFEADVAARVIKNIEQQREFAWRRVSKRTQEVQSVRDAAAAAGGAPASIAPLLQQALDELREAKGLLDAIEDQLDVARAAQSEKDEAAAAWEPDGCKVALGYLPAALITQQLQERSQLGNSAQSLEDLQRVAELDREVVRFGVRDHQGLQVRDEHVPFSTQPAEFRGRTFQVASDAVIDAYERHGWLACLAAAVNRFNTLHEEKKSGSPSSSGAKPATSAATGAPSK